MTTVWGESEKISGLHYIYEDRLERVGPLLGSSPCHI